MNNKILGLITLFSPSFKNFTAKKNIYWKIKEWKEYLIFSISRGSRA
jgi:hypothetical protein